MASKNDGAAAPQDTQGKTDKDLAAGYTAVITKVEGALDQLGVLRDLLREQGVEVSEAGEARRRAQDAALYDLGKQRQLVLDGYAREDAERELAYSERVDALVEREALLAELLGMTPEQAAGANGKSFRDTFAARVAAAEKAAEGKGKALADKEATAAKALAEAQAATASALLKQENDQLKKANAALEQQNKDLLANQQKVVGDMKEVATGAFNAAGGVVAQGNSALGTAAGSAGAARRPGQ